MGLPLLSSCEHPSELLVNIFAADDERFYESCSVLLFSVFGLFPVALHRTQQIIIRFN